MFSACSTGDTHAMIYRYTHKVLRMMQRQVKRENKIQIFAQAHIISMIICLIYHLSDVFGKNYNVFMCIISHGFARQSEH